MALYRESLNLQGSEKGVLLKKLLPWALFIILLSLLLSLGCWQLQRASEKKLLLQHYAQRLSAPPLSVQVLPEFERLTAQEWEFKRFSKVQLSGRFDAAHAIVMLNKIHEHQLGFHILIPFFAKGQDKPVLVNLGWVPHPAQGRGSKVTSYYQEIPTLPSLKGEYTFTGYIDLPGKGLTIGPAIAGDSTWPLPMTYLDFKAFEQAYHRTVFPYVVLLAENEQIGFIRVWHPVTMSPDRHVGYAVQWFSLAFTLVLIVIVLQLRQRKRRKKGESFYKND